MRHNYKYVGIRNGLIMVDNDMGRFSYPSNFIGCSQYKGNLIIYCDINGLLHNDNNKPCLISKDGEMYRKHGKVHREDGPAFIQYYHNSRIIRYAEWWLDNEQYIASQYLKLLVKDYNKTPADIEQIEKKYKNQIK